VQIQAAQTRAAQTQAAQLQLQVQSHMSAWSLSKVIIV
jgi:hypothetical protein